MCSSSIPTPSLPVVPLVSWSVSTDRHFPNISYSLWVQLQALPKAKRLCFNRHNCLFKRKVSFQMMPHTPANSIPCNAEQVSFHLFTVFSILTLLLFCLASEFSASTQQSKLLIFYRSIYRPQRMPSDDLSIPACVAASPFGSMPLFTFP